MPILGSPWAYNVSVKYIILHSQLEHVLCTYLNNYIWCCISRIHSIFVCFLHAAPLPAVDSMNQNSGVPTLMVAKDESMCSLPQCRRPRYKDTDGTVHPFCGRTHADLAKVMNIQGK